MRRLALLFPLLLALTSFAARPAFGPPAADDDPAARLASLGWLAGSWAGDAWGGRFHAHYSTPDGGKVLSYSRLVRDGREAYHEFEVFEARDGAVRLQPFPGGKRVDGFTLGTTGEREAVFENPDKDWPTRITYARVADEKLVITLDDPHGGDPKVEVFELVPDAE